MAVEKLVFEESEKLGGIDRQRHFRRVAPPQSAGSKRAGCIARLGAAVGADRRVVWIRSVAFHKFQRPVRVLYQSRKRVASRVRKCWPEAGTHEMITVSPARLLAPKVDQRPGAAMWARHGCSIVFMRKESRMENSQSEIAAKVTRSREMITAVRLFAQECSEWRVLIPSRAYSGQYPKMPVPASTTASSDQSSNGVPLTCCCNDTPTMTVASTKRIVRSIELKFLLMIDTALSG